MKWPLGSSSSVGFTFPLPRRRHLETNQNTAHSGRYRPFGKPVSWSAMSAWLSRCQQPRGELSVSSHRPSSGLDHRFLCLIRTYFSSRMVAIDDHTPLSLPKVGHFVTFFCTTSLTQDKHRGFLCGTPRRTFPELEPNATELPSFAPVLAYRQLRKDSGR